MWLPFVILYDTMFQEILLSVGPKIEKFDSWYRKVINPGCRMKVLLPFVILNATMFQEILLRVGPRIETFDTLYHKTISPGCDWPLHSPSW